MAQETFALTTPEVERGQVRKVGIEVHQRDLEIGGAIAINIAHYNGHGACMPHPQLALLVRERGLAD